MLLKGVVNTVKNCFLNNSCFRIFVNYRFSTNEIISELYLNHMSKPMVQLSVADFHFVKPCLIKHVLLV